MTCDQFDDTLCGGELQFLDLRGEPVQLRVRPGVIADLVPFLPDPADQVLVVPGLLADDKKDCRHVLALQDVENLRSPYRIGPIIKGEDDLFRLVVVGTAVAAQNVAGRQHRLARIRVLLHRRHR